LTFTPDAQWLVSCANDGVLVWPLGAVSGAARRLGTRGDWCYGLAVAPDGRQVLMGGPSGAYLAPFTGAPGRWLYRPQDDNVQGCAFDASGRTVATAPAYSMTPGHKAVRVWDLASGRVRALPLAPPGEKDHGLDWGVPNLAFTPEGRVLVAGSGGIRLFDPEAGTSTWIWTVTKSWWAEMGVSADARLVLAVAPADPKETQGHQVMLFDLAKQTQTSITSHGSLVTAVAVDPSGKTLVTGDGEGALRVGLADGSEPHRLCCHAGAVATIAVAPDSRWIASASGGEIRLWPMPDLTKPPLHTLPYEELMAKLRALTNLQVVEDEAAATGYKLEVGPFPGWKDVPTW
jgi:WD40 repeat protein